MFINVFFLHRCFKCEHVPSSVIDRFLDTLLDRCRFPGLTGGGAVRINFELVMPIVSIPSFLLLAANGPVYTMLSLCLMPSFCGFFYHTWQRRMKKARTKFFFVWGLTSLVFTYFLFEMIISSNTKVAYLDNMVISLAAIGIVGALMFVKKDPGIVAESKVQQYLHDSYAFFGLYPGRLEPQDEDLEGYEVVQMDEVEDGAESCRYSTLFKSL